jgi:hypothetical protein
MYCHLAVLLGFVLPLGGLLGPLLVWRLRRRELPEIDPHGKASLNFQLTMMVPMAAGTVLLVAAVAILRGHVRGNPVGYMLFLMGGATWAGILGMLSLASSILAVIAGAKAGKGEEFRYPVSIRFLK